jgi:glycosyltransferase involved in cell wall biosynthesis
MSLSISVVVPVMSSRRSLELVLRCLERQTLARGDFECVVVDDASGDGTSELLRAYRPGINLTHVRNEVGAGRAQARDTGWRRSAGEVVVFLDADVLPAPEWLEKYREEFDASGADVLAGSQLNLDVAPSSEDLPRLLASLTGAAPEELFGEGAAGQFRRLAGHARPGLFPHPVYEKLAEQLPDVCRAHPESLIAAYSFMASNAAVRRSQLEKTSGFNPCLRRFDDLELAIRLKKTGARFGFAEGARAYHLCDAARPAQWLTVNELLALFCRHPYRLLLLMQLWAQNNSPAPGAPRASVEETLEGVVRASADALPAGLAEEFGRLYKQPVPAHYRHHKDTMVDYHSSEAWAADEVTEELDRAVAEGLVVQRKGTDLYFDYNHTINWIRDSTLSMQRWIEEMVLSKKTLYHRTKRPSDLLTLGCRGRYEITIPADALPVGWERAVLNVPLPVAHKSQTEVRITDCFPANLLDYQDRQKGMALSVPLSRPDGGEIKIGYEFECRLHENAPVERVGGAGSAEDMTRYLRASFPPDYLRKARSLLQRLVPGGAGDAYETARAIYNWIQHNIIFLEPPLSYPYFAILDTGYGTCIDQTRLFINLCRLLGLPAREQCGAQLPSVCRVPYPVEVKTRGYSPFVHTWAEFYDPRRGWVPVEVNGFGDKALNAVNLPDAKVREQLRQWRGECVFGGMSPFRIYTGDQANKLPATPMVKSGAGWQSLPELSSSTVYTLTCDLSPVNIEDWSHD